MKRIDLNDMDVAMTFKGKGNSRRYTFNDFSDRIRVSNKVAKILKDRIKRNKNRNDMPKLMEMSEALVELKKTMRKPQLIHMPRNGGRVHCNTTHIWDGKNWTMRVGVLPVGQVKNEYPNVMELMYSKDNETFGDWFKTAGNVH